jgi:hypothetical protein
MSASRVVGAKTAEACGQINRCTERHAASACPLQRLSLPSSARYKLVDSSEVASPSCLVTLMASDFGRVTYLT